MPDESILVVEDDPTILTSVAELLDLEGYVVVTARNGAEALHVLSGARPELIVLDMRMPVLDGWGFANAVREHEPPVRILVMSAARDARRWAEEIHAVGHVEKPFEADDLLAAVRRALDDCD